MFVRRGSVKEGLEGSVLGSCISGSVTGDIDPFLDEVVRN